VIDAWRFTKDIMGRIKFSGNMRKNDKAWLPLRDDLVLVMKAPRSAFIEVAAAEVINRNKQV